MHVALAIYVWLGTMTSSPGPTPKTWRAAISATEPLLHGVPAYAPQYSAHSAPKALDSGPLIHAPESRIFCVTSRISSSMCIRPIGIRLDVAITMRDGGCI